jgi:endonuclease-3
MARPSRASGHGALSRSKKTAPGDAARVVDRLAGVFPGASTELRYTNAFELLVATILSAQSTDARVNQVTPLLFARYPDARALAAAATHDIEALIKPTGFFRAKTRALLGAAAALVERHRGEVPARMDDLIELPGVGRKTANVVLGHALGVPGLPVDRHVFRVANRIGIARAKTPEDAERQLCLALPPDRWTLASDVLILHGRRICRPRPACPRCVLTDLCLFYRSGAALRPVVTAPGAGGRRGRPAVATRPKGTDRPKPSRPRPARPRPPDRPSPPDRTVPRRRR